MRTLIISDLHLGSKNCHPEQVLNLLGRERYDRLVLNGDTINNLNLRKLKPTHWAVIDRLRREARSRDFILVRGNHDHDQRYLNYARPADGEGFGPYDVLPTLLGVPMVEEYRLDVAGRQYLVLHGDRFDPTMRYPTVTEMADWCYQLSQKVNHKLAKWLKKKSKKWGGILEFVRCQSVGHARRHNCEGVVTGHTHFADDLRVGETHYLNSGCWTELPGGYVLSDGRGIRQHFLA
jgi:UDP-2,3-diacylglucosamine pyrophosphatase LpxH